MVVLEHWALQVGPESLQTYDLEYIMWQKPLCWVSNNGECDVCDYNDLSLLHMDQSLNKL